LDHDPRCETRRGFALAPFRLPRDVLLSEDFRHRAVDEVVGDLFTLVEDVGQCRRLVNLAELIFSISCVPVRRTLKDLQVIAPDQDRINVTTEDAVNSSITLLLNWKPPAK